MDVRVGYRAAMAVTVAMTITVLSGCGSLPRNPVPVDRAYDGQLPGFSNIRFWEMQYTPDVKTGKDDHSDCSVLALSGGGASGAFGAGILSGWSASGTRPKFRIVTGISTGSLTAPMAFLGSEYDETLRKNYTTIRTKDILNTEGLFGWGIAPLIWGESYASTKPLQKMIAEMVDEKVLAAIAAEHAKGRRLYVGSTNIDAQRLVIWDMGAIASSGNPDALALFRKVMLASASIGGAFPPVLFDVEIDGKKYDEMHVDGGTITEVFGYGRLFAGTSGQEGLCSIYVIRNGKLDTQSQQVPRKAISIAIRSFDTLMTAHCWSDILRLYSFAQHDKVDFNYLSLPRSYVSGGKEMFDPVEMKRLFDLGYEMGKAVNKWNKTPPLATEATGGQWIWTP